MRRDETSEGGGGGGGGGRWGMGEARGEAGVRGSRNKLTGTADLQDHCTFFVHGAGKKKRVPKKSRQRVRRVSGFYSVQVSVSSVGY